MSMPLIVDEKDADTAPNDPQQPSACRTKKISQAKTRSLNQACETLLRAHTLLQEASSEGVF